MGDTEPVSILVLLPLAYLVLLPWGSKADTSGHGRGGCPSFLSVDVMKTLTNSNMGKKGLIRLMLPGHSPLGREPGKEFQAETWRQEPCRTIVCLLLHRLTFSYLSYLYSTGPPAWGMGAAHSGLDPPVSVNSSISLQIDPQVSRV